MYRTRVHSGVSEYIKQYLYYRCCCYINIAVTACFLSQTALFPKLLRNELHCEGLITGLLCIIITIISPSRGVKRRPIQLTQREGRSHATTISWKLHFLFPAHLIFITVCFFIPAWIDLYSVRICLLVKIPLYLIYMYMFKVNSPNVFSYYLTCEITIINNG